MYHLYGQCRRFPHAQALRLCCASCQGVWLDPGELECLTAQESQSWQTHFQRSAEHWTKRLQQKKRYREG
jgi:Zn-finger nucleic acid-binding protein